MLVMRRYRTEKEICFTVIDSPSIARRRRISVGGDF